MATTPMLVALLAAVAACRRVDVVASVQVENAGIERTAPMLLEQGRKYFLVQDFDYDQEGLTRGEQRRHCYEWQIAVTAGTDRVAAFRCPAFARVVSTSKWSAESVCSSKLSIGGREAGKNCRMSSCSFVAPRGGSATLRASLAETKSCPGYTPWFDWDIKPTKLVAKLARSDER